ncbi:MAG: FkbM family methyltransferase [Candidatus Hadarchaeales archaeon]
MKLKEIIWWKAPTLLFSLLLMAFWNLHPNRPKIWVAPTDSRWVLYHRGYKCVLTSPKSLLCVTLTPFELDTLYLHVKKGEIVVDVGACQGDFTLPAAKRVGKNGLVIAIEPEPRNLSILRQRVSSLKNVKVLGLAAWKIAGKINFYLSFSAGEHSLIPKPCKRIVKIEARPLDQIIRRCRAKKVDFLKIDVEGAEFEVLEGADEVLAMTKKVVVETHVVGRKLTWPEVQSLLERKGFNTYVEDGVIHAWKPS